MMKPELIIFSEYKLGGVQTFYYNLLSNDSTQLFDKKWIFTRSTKDKDALLPRSFDLCDEEIIFYNPSHGSWRNALSIKKSISNREGLILTNHSVELNALHYFPNPNKTVILFCHDIVYLQWAKEYSFLVDAFIAHNLDVFIALKNTFPDRIEDLYFIPFGINLSPMKRHKNLKSPLSIAFVARMNKLKGIFDLVKIDDKLKQKNIEVNWLVVGNGPDKDRFLTQIAHRENFTIHHPSDTKGVFDLIQHCDIFLLPSSLDGTPVALLEAMSTGLVPILYEFSPSIRSVVTPDTGFVVPIGAIDSVVEIVASLDVNRSELERLSDNAYHHAHEKYDAKDRSKDYYNLFADFKKLKRKQPFKKPYKNRLDQPWIPFVVAQFIRRLLSIFVIKN